MNLFMLKQKQYQSGQTWTNTWFKWSAVGKTSGDLIELPAHLSFRWENGRNSRGGTFI
jgi:hypothetical protein